MLAIIEAEMIGGSCSNLACISSKALIRNSEVAQAAGHTLRFGMGVYGATVDRRRVAACMGEVMAYIV